VDTPTPIGERARVSEPSESLRQLTTERPVRMKTTGRTTNPINLALSTI